MDDNGKTFTYYDVLGVRKDASQESLRDAYRSMAKKLHPDMGGSTQSMNMLTHAYNVLSNPGKRERYDASLKESPRTSSKDKNQPSAEDLLAQERQLVSDVRKSATRSIWVGVGLFVLGAIITGATYGAASGGGSYVFAWGPMLFGMIYIVRGMFNAISPYTLLRKAYDSPGYRHKFYLEGTAQPVKAVFAIVGVLIGGVVLLSIIGAISSSSTNANTSSLSTESRTLKSQHDACLSSYYSIGSDLDSINAQMDRYKASGYTSAYNSLVNRQNQLASDYTDKYNQCETLRLQYNSSLNN